MNDKDNNTSKLNNKRLRITFSIVVLLSISFAASFLITDYFTNPNKKRVETVEEDKNVLNQNGIYLGDDIKVILKDSEKDIVTKTLEDIKSEFGIIGETTKERLESTLKDKGYILKTENNNEMTFEKDSSNNLEANKFYLGELNGDIVIYKSLENGKLEKADVDLTPYRVMKLSRVGEEEQKMIRNNEFKYDSLEAALEAISAYGG